MNKSQDWDTDMLYTSMYQQGYIAVHSMSVFQSCLCSFILHLLFSSPTHDLQCIYHQLSKLSVKPAIVAQYTQPQKLCQTSQSL